MKHGALSKLGRRSEPPAISWLMEMALSRPQMISLAAGFTDNESLPVDDVREVMGDTFEVARGGAAALAIRQHGGRRQRCGE